MAERRDESDVLDEHLAVFDYLIIPLSDLPELEIPLVLRDRNLDSLA
jgi:hypothetical protein